MLRIEQINVNTNRCYLDTNNTCKFKYERYSST